MLRTKASFGCRSSRTISSIESPIRTIRNPLSLPAVAATLAVSVGGGVTPGVPTTPSSSPVDELVVVVETLDSVPVLVAWVVVLDSLVVLDSEPVLVVSDVVSEVVVSLVVSDVVSVVVSVVVVDVVVGVVVVEVVVVSDSPQFSEFVLLGEITLPPSLTANTPRMPPVVAVNADVTVIDQAMTLPLVLFAPVRVIDVSFLETLPIGSAFDPLFGARYTVMIDPTSRVFVSVNEPSMWPTLSP